jgi:hypothetical protein
MAKNEGNRDDYGDSLGPEVDVRYMAVMNSWLPIINSIRELGTELEWVRRRWALRQPNPDQPHKSSTNAMRVCSTLIRRWDLSSWTNLGQFLDRVRRHYDRIVDLLLHMCGFEWWQNNCQGWLETLGNGPFNIVIYRGHNHWRPTQRDYMLGLFNNIHCFAALRE